jgi:hypothetical protein
MPDEVAPAIDEMNREGAKGRCVRSAAADNTLAPDVQSHGFTIWKDFFWVAKHYAAGISGDLALGTRNRKLRNSLYL